MLNHDDIDMIGGLILSILFFVLGPILLLKLANTIEEKNDKREINDTEYKIVAYQLSVEEELKPTIAKTMEDSKITREEYRKIHDTHQEINKKKLQQDILKSVQKAEK